MDKEEADITPGEEWLSSLNATCNRLSTQYLNLLRAAAGGSFQTSSMMNMMLNDVPELNGSGVTADNIVGLEEHESRKQLDRGGGGKMIELNEPPAPLAADAALSTLQTKLAAENICVAVSHLLDLIRTLRLSALLMEEGVIGEEEEEEFQYVKELAKEAALISTKMEEELMAIRNKETQI